MILLLCLCICVVATSVNIYAPASPCIASIFGMSEVEIAFTISLNFFFIGCFSLVYGPLSDYFGRKYVLVCGLAILAIATIGTLFSHSGSCFTITRAIQGVGCAGLVPVGCAVIRDISRGKRLARYMSLMNVTIALSSILAPVFGVVIMLEYGWEGIFIAVTGFTVALLVCITLWFPETFPKQNRAPSGASITKLFKGYKELLVNKEYMYYVSIKNTASCFVLTDMACTPLFLDNLSEVVSISLQTYISCCVVCSIVSLVLTSVLLQRFSLTKVINYGIVISFCFSVISIVLLCYSENLALISKIFIYLGLQMIYGPTSAASLENIEGTKVGSATSLSASSCMLITVVLIMVVNYFHHSTPPPVVLLPTILFGIDILLVSRRSILRVLAHLYHKTSSRPTK